MMLPDDKYRAVLGGGWEIAQVPDFHGLLGKSQEHSKAVFALTDDDLDMSGKVEKTYIASRDNFKEIFKSFAAKVVELANDRHCSTASIQSCDSTGPFGQTSHPGSSI
ncbi:hypothetical protein [Burkholderia gladioli]|uniref:hypothetical protein n=1 Tax=Burkholderia gladioli TaxID=28095 RepID=UPI001364C2CC|nr:hypothetical protein [Burkholderia gladioli]